ncbi:hypothetical protein GQ53DRAFT_224905 [Thozetella sp. PMI_491]|nr:hypothetical protein GQ53DRAFT_224905 [Thozetella sp. PMI_491]
MTCRKAVIVLAGGVGHPGRAGSRGVGDMLSGNKLAAAPLAGAGAAAREVKHTLQVPPGRQGPTYLSLFQSPSQTPRGSRSAPEARAPWPLQASARQRIGCGSPSPFYPRTVERTRSPWFAPALRFYIVENWAPSSSAHVGPRQPFCIRIPHTARAEAESRSARRNAQFRPNHHEEAREREREKWWFLARRSQPSPVAWAFVYEVQYISQYCS